MNRLLIVFSLASIMFCAACNDKEGCTDRFALNWDVEANNEDGSCEYASTRFLGEYLAIQDCEVSPSVNYQLTIMLDPNPTSANPEFMQDVILDSEYFPMIKGTMVGITEPFIIVESQDISIPSIGDVSFSGEAKLSEDNILTFEVKRFYNDSMNDLVIEDCTILAMKN